MATSGTATFDLSIDEIVEEAYERDAEFKLTLVMI